MTLEHEKLDALQKPVVIGQTYGYSCSSSSFITVVLGTVKKFTDKKVTLDVTQRRTYMYGEEINRSWSGQSKIVSVHPCHLFPVTP